ncbi:hypothetical protein KAS79_04215 [Candidatus Parcubacteria bacterium]|nr:hypothetical protein [Candidatus Parcubacteria bacterium]
MECILGITIGILLSCLAFFVGLQLKHSDKFQDVVSGQVKLKDIIIKPKGKIFKRNTELQEVISNNKKGIKIK